MTTQITTSADERIAEIDEQLTALHNVRPVNREDAQAHRRAIYRLENERRVFRKTQIKEQKAAVEATRLVLTAALEPAKQAAMKYAGAQALKRAEENLARMEAAGWNVNVLAPRPPKDLKYGDPRAEEMREARARAMSFVRWDKAKNDSLQEATGKYSYTANDDHGWVVRADELVKQYAEDVRQATARSFEGYVAKMAAKVGPGATACSYTGYLWSQSYITVETPAGRQLWKTQQILNLSVLGTPYNQWPSRQVKEGGAA